MGTQGDPSELHFVRLSLEISRAVTETYIVPRRPGYVLTNLTKVILDANTELRDTWVNMTPMVGLYSSPPRDPAHFSSFFT